MPNPEAGVLHCFGPPTCPPEPTVLCSMTFHFDRMGQACIGPLNIDCHRYQRDFLSVSSGGQDDFPLYIYISGTLEFHDYIGRQFRDISLGCLLSQ